MGRAKPVAAACVAAEETGIEHLHETCRGNGPMYLPGVTAPVLPAEECGCGCHSPQPCNGAGGAS